MSPAEDLAAVAAAGADDAVRALGPADCILAALLGVGAAVVVGWLAWVSLGALMQPKG